MINYNFKFCIFLIILLFLLSLTNFLSDNPEILKLNKQLDEIKEAYFSLENNLSGITEISLITDNPNTDYNFIKKFYMTQFAFAPILIKTSPDSDFLLAYFDNNIREESINNNFSVICSSYNNIKLLGKKR